MTTPTRDEAVLKGDAKEIVDRLRAVSGNTRRLSLDAAMMIEHLYASAPASGGVDAVACRHEPYLGECAHCGIKFKDGRPVALSPAATPVSEAGGEVEQLKAYRDELLKIAADVGEPDDPFAAWEAIAALKALAKPAGGDVHWTIESLAQWLHDETEHQESYPGCHWPEHPDDDGNRDGGFIKIVPKHAQAYFRQMAARCFGVRPFSDAYFRALKGEPALSQSTSAGRDAMARLAKGEREGREHLYGCTVDLAPDEEPDGCVLDYGAPSDCTYARARRTKWTCPMWRLKSEFAGSTPNPDEAEHG